MIIWKRLRACRGGGGGDVAQSRVDERGEGASTQTMEGAPREMAGCAAWGMRRLALTIVVRHSHFVLPIPLAFEVPSTSTVSVEFVCAGPSWTPMLLYMSFRLRCLPISSVRPLARLTTVAVIVCRLLSLDCTGACECPSSSTGYSRSFSQTLFAHWPRPTRPERTK